MNGIEQITGTRKYEVEVPADERTVIDDTPERYIVETDIDRGNGDAPVCTIYGLYSGGRWIANAAARWLVMHLLQKNERLHAIVGKLDKTADGVPVVPDTDVVWHPKVRDNAGDMVAMGTFGEGYAAWSRTPDVTYPVCECYSTREAAEQAREEQP